VETEGDNLLRKLEALSNTHRLRILNHLHQQGRAYISQMARDVGISRPLLHMHLKKLEHAGLVKGQLELSEDGKALNWFSATNFNIHLTPAGISEAAQTLSPPKPKNK